MSDGYPVFGLNPATARWHILLSDSKAKCGNEAGFTLTCYEFAETENELVCQHCMPQYGVRYGYSVDRPSTVSICSWCGEETSSSWGHEHYAIRDIA